MEMIVLGLLEKAKLYATEAHQGQTRKGSSAPMITHPIRVAETLKKAGLPDYVVAAGYLHDTVEDTSVTIEMIKEEFGEYVGEVVQGNTENKDHSWEERKQHTIDSIAAAPLHIKALIVADKLDNLSCLIVDYEVKGEEIWKVFKRGRKEQRWYFKGVAENMVKGLDDVDIPSFFEEYKLKVQAFFS